MSDPFPFGPAVPSRPFSIDGFFDPQLQDRLNLGLSEDPHNLLCALCIAASILLLTDIIFRAIARIDFHHVTIIAIYRASLLSLSTSVLNLFPEILNQRSNPRTEREPTNEKPVPPPAVRLCDRPTQIGIVCAGLLLTGTHFVLLFLALNRNAAVPIDKARLPALRLTAELRDSSLPSNDSASASSPPPLALLVEPQTFCTQHQIAGGKTAFSSEASISLCRGIEPASPGFGSLGSTNAVILLSGRDTSVFVYVATSGFSETLYLSSAVNLRNRRQFDIRSTVRSGSDVENALRVVLHRRGFRVDSVDRRRDSDENENISWDLEVYISFLEGKTVPNNVRETMNTPLYQDVYLNESNPNRIPTHDVAWTRYVMATVSSLFDFYGEAGAFERAGEKRGLETYDVPLVRGQRPWLSMAGCIGMLGALVVTWMVVAFLLRWEAGVEYYADWNERFSRVSTGRDFNYVLQTSLVSDTGHSK